MGINIFSLHKLSFGKSHRVLLAILLLVSYISCLPIGRTIASEVGGYVSEKLLSRSNVSNSQLVIGGSSNSLLDIQLSSEEGTPSTHLNRSESAGRLAVIIPTIFMAVAIFLLVGMLMSGQMSLPLLIIAAILILLAVSGVDLIQAAVTALFGG